MAVRFFTTKNDTGSNFPLHILYSPSQLPQLEHCFQLLGILGELGKLSIRVVVPNVWGISFGVFDFSLTHLFLSFHFAFQTINFTDPFFAPPVVIVTPKYSYNDNYSFSSDCSAVVTWVEVSHMCAARSIWLVISRKSHLNYRVS